MACPPAAPYRRSLTVTRLLIVNPNSTAGTTDRIGDEARNDQPDWVELASKTSESGPASIQGAADRDATVVGILGCWAKRTSMRQRLAVFDSTGIVHHTKSGPYSVASLGEASIRLAANSGYRFAVLTIVALSVPVLVENVPSDGMDAHCVCIRASAIDVLAFVVLRSVDHPLLLLRNIVATIDAEIVRHPQHPQDSRPQPISAG